MESVKIKDLKKRFTIVFRCCFGCAFESNDNEFLDTHANIAIEWESSAYYLQYLPSREQVNTLMNDPIGLIRFF